MGYNVQNHSCFQNETDGNCVFTIANKVFMMNVAVSDLLMSVIGVFRGLGITTTIFYTPEGGVSWFCPAYAILLNSVTSVCMLVLIPLTLDRFLAIVFPFQHRYLITVERSISVVMVTWILPGFLLVFDTVTFLTGHKEIKFNEKYHRCVSQDKVESAVVQILAIIIPLILIPIIYTIMLVVVGHNQITSKRFFVMCTAIVVSGYIGYLPSAITSMFDISMSYEFAQILTVTLYYANSTINPLIYFCSHPRTKDIIKGQRHVRTTTVSHHSHVEKNKKCDNGTGGDHELYLEDNV